MTTIRTLLVDDAILVRKALCQILKNTEFEVVGEAGDGRDALEKCRALNPDLVLMDIMLPGMDGITAVRHIAEEHPHTRVVICTALSQDRVIMEALSAGAAHFISKPFLPDQVLRTLRFLFPICPQDGEKH